MSRSENIREAALSVPTVSVAGLSLVGVSLQDWVLIATLTWLAIQITWFGYNRYTEYHEKKTKRLEKTEGKSNGSI